MDRIKRGTTLALQKEHSQWGFRVVSWRAYDEKYLRRSKAAALFRNQVCDRGYPGTSSAVHGTDPGLAQQFRSSSGTTVRRQGSAGSSVHSHWQLDRRIWKMDALEGIAENQEVTEPLSSIPSVPELPSKQYVWSSLLLTATGVYVYIRVLHSVNNPPQRAIGEAITARSIAIDYYQGLGPPDLCCVTKQVWI